MRKENICAYEIYTKEFEKKHPLLRLGKKGNVILDKPNHGLMS